MKHLRTLDAMSLRRPSELGNLTCATNGHLLEWRKEGIPSIEECHRLTCQHSARDVYGGEWRLFGDLGTCNRDLLNLARKLIDGSRKDEA